MKNVKLLLKILLLAILTLVFCFFFKFNTFAANYNSYKLYVYDDEGEVYSGNIELSLRFDKNILFQNLNEKIVDFDSYYVVRIQLNGCDVSFADSSEMDNYMFDEEINQIFVTLSKNPVLYDYDYTIRINDNNYNYTLNDYPALNDITSFVSVNRFLFESKKELNELSYDDFYIDDFYFDGHFENGIIKWDEDKEGRYEILIVLSPRNQSYEKNIDSQNEKELKNENESLSLEVENESVDDKTPNALIVNTSFCMIAIIILAFCDVIFIIYIVVHLAIVEKKQKKELETSKEKEEKNN